jgi:hypothetical protein
VVLRRLIALATLLVIGVGLPAIAQAAPCARTARCRHACCTRPRVTGAPEAIGRASCCKPAHAPIARPAASPTIVSAVRVALVVPATRLTIVTPPPTHDLPARLVRARSIHPPPDPLYLAHRSLLV